MTETYVVDGVQYLRPDGRTKKVETDLPIKSEEYYIDMMASNCRFEIEELTTGEISVTISSEEADVDIEVVGNGPDVQVAMVEMLKRRKWEVSSY
jgi:hypothetical protein